MIYMYILSLRVYIITSVGYFLALSSYLGRITLFPSAITRCEKVGGGGGGGGKFYPVNF